MYGNCRPENGLTNIYSLCSYCNGLSDVGVTNIDLEQLLQLCSLRVCNNHSQWAGIAFVSQEVGLKNIYMSRYYHFPLKWFNIELQQVVHSLPKIV
jgi:hypothetical protein